MQYIVMESIEEGVVRRTIVNHVRLIVRHNGYWGSENILFQAELMENEAAATEYLREWMEARDNMGDNDKPVNLVGCAVRYKQPLGKHKYMIEWMVCYEYWR